MLFFAAEWSEESKLMGEVLNELDKDAKYQNNSRILQIEAEDNEQISIKYGIEAVPTFVFLKVNTAHFFGLVQTGLDW